MRPSLFPADEELPTWLHSIALVVLVAVPVGFLIWFGLLALVTGHLEPLSGPEAGQYFFGPAALQGKAARLAGFSLLTLACAFTAIAYRFSRFFNETRLSRALPWALLAVSQWLALWVRSVQV